MSKTDEMNVEKSTTDRRERGRFAVVLVGIGKVLLVYACWIGFLFAVVRFSEWVLLGGVAWCVYALRTVPESMRNMRRNRMLRREKRARPRYKHEVETIKEYLKLASGLAFIVAFCCVAMWGPEPGFWRSAMFVAIISGAITSGVIIDLAKFNIEDHPFNTDNRKWLPTVARALLGSLVMWTVIFWLGSLYMAYLDSK